MPRWAQSIRFRLALAYASAVFATGAVLLAGLYAWQVHRLTSTIYVRPDRVGYFIDPTTGQPVAVGLSSTRQQVQIQMEQQRREVYLRSLDELRRSSLIGLGLMSVVAFGSGWLLSGWALRPVGRMSATAREISGTELSRRIALVGPQDELKDLADTFDEMLDRLQASFEDQRRFVQDASHELRNPLAVAQTNLELVLSDPDATVDELRRSATIAHESTGRISHIVEDLLAQARHGVPEVSGAEVDLVALAAGVAAEMEAEAARRGIRIVVAGPVGISAGPGVEAAAAVSGPDGAGFANGAPVALLGEAAGAPGALVGGAAGARGALLGEATGAPGALVGGAAGAPGALVGGAQAGEELLGHAAVGAGAGGWAPAGGWGPAGAVAVPPAGPPLIANLGAGGPPEEPASVVVHGDPAALRRAVSNLVANAVRLAPANSMVTITPGQAGPWATISVADEGPGITPEDQTRVFERFWRGADAGKGLGLGLSIVRQVAQRHGGTVQLESEPGRGSTFTIALPLPVTRPAAP